MRKILTISVLLLTLTIHGQTDINQTTDKGQKTGKWVEYYDNGEIEEVKYFEPAERILEPKETFFLGIQNYKDTIIYEYDEILLLKDTYEYNDDWTLKRIKRTEAPSETIYLYGPNKEIGLKPSDFNFIDRVNKTQTVSIELTNNTDYPIALKPVFNFTTDNHEFILPAKHRTTFEFKLTFEPNDNSYIVKLKNDNINIDFSVRTFGYHIDSRDIEKGQQLTVKRSFIYHRTGGEALLKLYDKDKEKELKTISLAKQRTNIDLKKIKAGDYWFCTIDYSTDKQTYCKVKIEK